MEPSRLGQTARAIQNMGNILRSFEHGDMNQPGWALDTFLEHARTARVVGIESGLPHIKVKSDNFNVLELGPGDSLFTAVIARALGASRTWLVDAAPFATTDMSVYVELIEFCGKRDLGCALNAIRNQLSIFFGYAMGNILPRACGL